MSSCYLTVVPYAEMWMQAIASYRSAALTPFFLAISNILAEVNIILIIAIGYWFISKRSFYRIGLLSVISLGINIQLKGIFLECRPMTVSWLQVGKGFSFPSGHAQMATTLFGSIAQATRHLSVRLLLITLIVLILFSRNYLGVHYVHDVLAGLLVGLVIIFTPWPTYLISRFRLSIQMIIVLVLIAIWASSINAPPSGKLARYMGALYGFWLGGQLELRHVHHIARFNKHTPWRMFIGLAGIVVLWGGPKWGLDFSQLEANTKSIVSCIQYFILTMWITFGAPYLFNKFTQSNTRSV